MPKPTAVVTASIRSRSARVAVWAPDPAHTTAAVDAAQATSAWCIAGTDGVVVEQPYAMRTCGGAAEVERIRFRAQGARDAAKAVLRSLGYTVRASHS